MVVLSHAAAFLMALSVFPDTVLSGFSCRRPPASPPTMPTAEHQALIDRCAFLLAQWEALLAETPHKIGYDLEEGFQKAAFAQEVGILMLGSCVSELRVALGDDLSEGQQGGEADR